MAALAEKDKVFPWLGNEKTPKDSDKCFSDDAALGIEFPSVETVEYIKEEAPKDEKPTLYLFWAKFAKGHFGLFMEFGDIDRVFEVRFDFVPDCDESNYLSKALLVKLSLTFLFKITLIKILR